MRCADPRCTGDHNDRHWDNLCPRTKESKCATERRRYERMSWFERHAEQLRTRRLIAVQRMERRMRGAVQKQG